MAHSVVAEETHSNAQNFPEFHHFCARPVDAGALDDAQSPGPFQTKEGQEQSTRHADDGSGLLCSDLPLHPRWIKWKWKQNSIERKTEDFTLTPVLLTFLSVFPLQPLSDFLFKFLVIGSAGTGKSCLLHQFIENKCEFTLPRLFVFAPQRKVVSAGRLSLFKVMDEPV